MPKRSTVEAFAATVESNDHVNAILNFYAPDARTQENDNPPRIGRDLLAERERQVLASVAGVKTTRLGPLLSRAITRRSGGASRSPARTARSAPWKKWRCRPGAASN